MRSDRADRDVKRWVTIRLDAPRSARNVERRGGRGDTILRLILLNVDPDFGTRNAIPSPRNSGERVPEGRVRGLCFGNGPVPQVAVALAFSFFAARAFLRSALAALASAVVAVLVNRSFRRTALPESWRR
jgi:hypothetical protein